MIDDKKLSTTLDQVLTTISFYGIKLVKIDTEDLIPTVYLNLYKKKLKKSIDETLNIAYWVFWTFLYGKYSKRKEKKYKLEIKYNIIEV